MKIALKNRWIAALRSGDYKQNKGSLRREHNGKVSHCCLGVLCEISPKMLSLKISNNHYLQTKALEFSGISDAEQRKLAEMNDGKGYGFKRIATYIEKHL